MNLQPVNDFYLIQEQNLSLRLTPTMTQYLSILQMPVAELKEVAEKEFMENPFLEIASYNEADKTSKEYWEKNEKSEHNDSLNFVSKNITLKDFLNEQAGYLKEDKMTVRLCHYLIECLDSNGYLDLPDGGLDYLAVYAGCDMHQIYHALMLLQSFEPVGVGARNLQECLLIQLKAKNLAAEPLVEIVKNYLNLAADNKIKELAAKLCISCQQACDYIDIIRSLEPKPGRSFSDNDLATNYIVPEAEVKIINDEIVIFMDEGYVPKFYVNSFYIELLKTSDDAEVKKYVADKFNSAVGLINGIEKRNKTLYRTLEAACARQKEYLLMGDKYRKPLTMKEVGQELGLHESTISRTIKDKYVLLPAGVKRIKDLFCNSFDSFNNTSTFEIKNELQNMLNSEDKSKPLSDQEICNSFKNRGVDISRRTISKYRDELGIASSSKRRKYK